MTEAVENPRAVIGGNQPPEPTPLEAFTTHIADLMEAARQFLDGEPITTQAQAGDVGRLLDQCRTAAKDADKARAAEKEPYLTAGREVDAAWKPLIGQCNTAAATAKKALAPFLAAEQARLAAEAAEARRIANEQAEAAREAARSAAASDSLARREEAERKVAEAERANKAADRAEKGKASAAGGGRAVTLRDVWTPEVTDRRAALNHYAVRNPDGLTAWVLAQAQADVRAGSRSIPGITIHHEQVAQ